MVTVCHRALGKVPSPIPWLPHVIFLPILFHASLFALNSFWRVDWLLHETLAWALGVLGVVWLLYVLVVLPILIIPESLDRSRRVTCFVWIFNFIPCLAPAFW